MPLGWIADCLTVTPRSAVSSGPASCPPVCPAPGVECPPLTGDGRQTPLLGGGDHPPPDVRQPPQSRHPTHRPRRAHCHPAPPATQTARAQASPVASRTDCPAHLRIRIRDPQCDRKSLHGSPLKAARGLGVCPGNAILLRQMICWHLRRARPEQILNVFQRIRLRFFRACGLASTSVSFASQRKITRTDSAVRIVACPGVFPHLWSSKIRTVCYACLSKGTETSAQQRVFRCGFAMYPGS